MSYSREKHINVQPSKTSIIDSEFNSMRDKFDTEMRRVEDEMSRLRREFESYTPKMHQSPDRGSPSAMHQTQSHHSTSSSSNNYYRSGSPGVTFANGGADSHVKPRYDPYLDGIKSPLIRDDSDGKTLRLRFDVSQYLPEEVTVKTVDNRLLVHGKHEEKTTSKTVYREYNQEFMLPRGTNPELITSSLSVDGILTVEAPLPALEQAPQRLPITHK